MDRLESRWGGRPVIGKFTPADLRDLAQAANTPLVTIPAGLLLLGLVGRSPYASRYLEEGIACMARGIGQGVAAAMSGAARGLWEGFVYDPDPNRQGGLESLGPPIRGAAQTLFWNPGEGRGIWEKLFNVG